MEEVWKIQVRNAMHLVTRIASGASAFDSSILQFFQESK